MIIITLFQNNFESTFNDLKMEGFYKPRTYEIKINGHLDQSWAEWFEGMTITYDKQTTILKGEVADNSSLHSLLNRLYDLNLIIISLEHINSNN